MSASFFTVSEESREDFARMHSCVLRLIRYSLISATTCTRFIPLRCLEVAFCRFARSADVLVVKASLSVIVAVLRLRPRFKALWTQIESTFFPFFFCIRPLCWRLYNQRTHIFYFNLFFWLRGLKKHSSFVKHWKIKIHRGIFIFTKVQE